MPVLAARASDGVASYFRKLVTAHHLADVLEQKRPNAVLDRISPRLGRFPPCHRITTPE